MNAKLALTSIVASSIALVEGTAAAPVDNLQNAAPTTEAQPKTIFEAQKKTERPSSYILYDYLSTSEPTTQEEAEEQEQAQADTFWQQNNWH